MPNWVTNTGTIMSDKDTITKILETITSDRSMFDFYKIIPEPQTKEECKPEYYKTEHSAIVEDVDKPWFNWYKWHCDNWGTKWDACDPYVQRISDTELSIYFDTAWSFPYPIWKKLATKFPSATFNIKFADEDLGNNCGYFTSTGGVYRMEWVDTLEFACEVMGYTKEDLKEWGYDI